MNKVLHLTNSFHQGGSERQAVQLVNLLHNDGSYKVFLACLNDEGVLRREVETIGYKDFPEYKLTSFFNLNFFKQVRSCAQFIKENNIDIIHTHDFYTNVFGMLAAMLAGVKAKIASKRETGGMRSGTQKTVEKQAFRIADGIVVNSEAVKKYLINEGVSGEKLNVIYNGLDLERLKPDACLNRESILNLLNLPDGKRFVTLVANLRHEVKNQPMFLRVAKRVKEKVNDAAFVIAGEGELMEPLKSLAAEFGIAKDCHFIGRCSHVPELLSVSEIGVLSSFNEGFSNSILEYMASGLPVVATDVGGAAEAIVEDKTGFLIESDNDRQMAEKVIWLLENSVKAREMGQEGRLLTENKFSCRAQLENTLALYDKLLQV